MPRYSRSGHGDRYPRKRGFHYGPDAAYFVTIVTAGRAPLFGRLVSGRMELNPFGKIVQSTWISLPEHQPSVLLGAFVVMPDHFHSATTRAINLLRGTPGERVWQSNSHDQLIHTEGQRRRTARYVMLNPRRG